MNRAVVTRVVATWILSFVLWLVLAAEVSVQELVAGALAASLVTAFVELLARLAPEAVHPRVRWVRHLPGAAWQTLEDCVIITAHLGRVLRGRGSGGAFRSVSYHPLPDDPGEGSRRAFMTFVTTLQPNSYVVGFDEARGEVITHQLVPTEDAPIASSLLEPPDRDGGR